MCYRPCLALLVLASAAATLGCAEETAAPVRDEREVMQAREEQVEQQRPESIASERGGVTGEVPAGLLARMEADLAERVPGAETKVLVAEAVTWPDGSMGCGEPGQNYTMQLVPGYRVVFEADGRRWHYHANRGGRFLMCEKPAAVPRRSPST